MCFPFQHERSGLLVSVRSVDEALAALCGGADIIDVKEPARGSLGAADRQTLRDVVGVAEGRAPVTAAVGELADLVSAVASGDCEPVPPGVLLFKTGLAGCAEVPDWPARWRHVAAAIGGTARPVAVAYADWKQAGAPRPEEVLELAVTQNCPALLVDTWDKSAGTLLDHWSSQHLASFVQRVRSQGVTIVLAGSLSLADIGTVSRLDPDLVAVRSAACDGGRAGRVSRQRVAALRRMIDDGKRVAALPEPSPSS